MRCTAIKTNIYTGEAENITVNVRNPFKTKLSKDKKGNLGWLHNNPERGHIYGWEEKFIGFTDVVECDNGKILYIDVYNRYHEPII